MKTSIGILILAAYILPHQVFANDGFAALGVGGVTIAKTGKIAIKREVLDIACDNIQVSYDFINESDNDEDAVLMFPLPSYPANPAKSLIFYYGQPSGFSIKVDGNLVSYDTEVTATSKGRDVTNVLKSIGLSVKQIALFPFDETLMNSDYEIQIPKSKIDLLKKEGLVVLKTG